MGLDSAPGVRSAAAAALSLFVKISTLMSQRPPHCVREGCRRGAGQELMLVPVIQAKCEKARRSLHKLHPLSESSLFVIVLIWTLEAEA